jgi:hypothetical protein
MNRFNKLRHEERMLSNVRADIQEYPPVDTAGFHEIPEEKVSRMRHSKRYVDRADSSCCLRSVAEKVGREVKILAVAAPKSGRFLPAS